MTDDKPPMPPQPTTKQIPAVEPPPAWALAIIKTVKEGFSEVENRLDGLETNLDLQGGTVRDVAKRMTRLEERQDAVEDRQRTASVRVKQASDVDLQHEAAIGGLVADVAALKATQDEQLSILKRLDAVAGNPMVRKVAYAIGGAILAYLAAKGH